MNVTGIEHSTRTGRRHHDGQRHARIGPSRQRANAVLKACASEPDKIDDILILDKDGKYMGGIKFANGTNSIRSGGGNFPGTRAKSVSLVREQFIKAQEYRDKIKKAAGDATKMPPPRPRDGSAGRGARRQAMVHFHTHRHDDIMSVLRLQKEFGFRVDTASCQRRLEGRRRDRQGKSARVDDFVDSPGGKLETTDIKFETGAILEKAGVLVGFHTDDSITDSRWFMR